VRRFLTTAGPLVAIVAAVPLVHAAMNPLNDLLDLGAAGGQQLVALPVQFNPEPPLVAAPRPVCDAGARPEPGVQGRVPAGAAAAGLSCNVKLVSRHGTSGGFKTWRYIDSHGRECAYYDTALLYPLNALKLSSTSTGVVVLDMSDPAHPVQTDTLTSLPMLSPHESVSLNPKRGLIAAVLGNPATYPGLVSIYDAHEDCRHPVHQSTALIARFGHESGFSPDGNTFYAAGTAVKAVTAIDVTNPKSPHPIWHGQVSSHGMAISEDGNRAYIADATGGFMLILDTSEIQARRANPQAREVSRLSWKTHSIPQNAYPFTKGGKPYVLEFDEYNAGASVARGGSTDTVGAARIIDISDERKPRVFSNIRLEVNQPAAHKAAGSDPGASSPVQGYAAHYCSLSSRVNPTVVACSFITSGLRIFDISDLRHPKEIAYYVAPPKPRFENGYMSSSYAMSRPSIVPSRREVWYSDGTTGFYVLRVDKAVWPSSRSCKVRREVLVRLRVPSGTSVRSVTATFGGRRARVVRRAGAYYAVVDLRAPRSSSARLVARVRGRNGRSAITRQSFRHLCAR
jgi:hypothetical protein